MEYIEDYKSYDIDTLWISGIKRNKKSYGDNGDNGINFSKSLVYKNPDKLERLLAKTPYLFIPYGISKYNKNTGAVKYSLTVALSPISGIREVFLEFLENIDKYIESRLSNLVPKKYSFVSSIKQNDDDMYTYKLVLNFPTVQGNYDFLIHDHNKETKQLSYIRPRTKMISIIELDDIWINDNDKKYGTSWNIRYIKIYPIVKTLDVSDDEEEQVVDMKNKRKEIKKIKCPSCKNRIELVIRIDIPEMPSRQYVSQIPLAPSISYQPSYSIPQPSSNDSSVRASSFVPKLDDLLSAIGKLKKVSQPDEKNGMETGRVVNDDVSQAPEAPPLTPPSSPNEKTKKKKKNEKKRN